MLGPDLPRVNQKPETHADIRNEFWLFKFFWLILPSQVNENNKNELLLKVETKGYSGNEKMIKIAKINGLVITGEITYV